MLPSSIINQEHKSAQFSGVYLSLGSNLRYLDQTPRTNLVRALNSLQAGGDKIIASSSLWRSDAWPAGTGAPSFINAVCQISPLDNNPANLLSRLHTIEAKFGRQRNPLNRWNARSLDLDLLDYNGIILQNNSFLELPHPRIHSRDFVLMPLLEISPNWVHPISGTTGRCLLDHLKMLGPMNNCSIEPTDYA
jgi:2-amino-4-hydroxy-6-hydroxymethyldihydropteridine diphosphokinase